MSAAELPGTALGKGDDGALGEVVPLAPSDRASDGASNLQPARWRLRPRWALAGLAGAVALLGFVRARHKAQCWEWSQGLPAREAKAFSEQVAALQRAPRRLGGAFLGGKELCSGRWAPSDFKGVEEAERGTGAWLRALYPVVEHFEEEAEQRRRGTEQACSTYPMVPQAVFQGLLPQGPTCTSLELLGKDDGSADWRDGAKYACGLSALTEGCVIVSLGSRNDWRFEEAVFDRLPQCSVLTLDCTLEATVPQRIRERVRFEKLCVAAEDFEMQGRLYLSWASFSRRFLQRPPALLKMDIEGYEFGVLRSIFAAPEASQPSQLLLELHWRSGIFSRRRWGEGSSGELLAFMLGVLEAGYRFVHADWATLCPHCIEVTAAKLYCEP